MPCRLLSILIILLLAAGCGSGSLISDPEGVRKVHGDEIKEILFWNSYSDEETGLLEQKLIPLFEREYPNIRVKSLHIWTNKELKNTLETRAFASRGPDVVRMDITWIPEFSAKGLLQPLDRFPGFDEIRGTFPPEAMNIGLYQNRHYSVPLNLYTEAAIFNREQQSRAGYSAPPATMEEVFKLARQNRFTIGLRGFEIRNTLPYLSSLGGRFANEEFTKASGYLNGKETVRAVEQLLGLYREKIIKFSVVSGGIDHWEEVKDDDLFMIDEGPWFYSKYNETGLGKALDLTVPVPFPRHDDRPVSIVRGEDLVILKGSKLPDEAWTFIKWMAGKEPQLVMSKVGMFPTNPEAVQAMALRRDLSIPAYKQALDDAYRLPPTKHWSQIDEVYTGYMQQIFREELSVKDGLDRAAAEIDKLLDDR